MASQRALDRREKVDQMRIQGLSGYAIAKRLGVPVATVYRDIEALEKAEQEESLKVVREQKRLEIDKQYQRQIAEAERLMRKALRRGKKTKTVVREGEHGFTEQTEETYLPHYNAAIGFQRNLIEAVMARARLWGVEQAKQQLEVSGLDELLGALAEAAAGGKDGPDTS